MTNEEEKAVNLSAELWNQFMQLPILHPDDQNDFRFHIHALQSIIMSRAAYREQPNLFYQKKTPREEVIVITDIGSTSTKTGK